jgi:hypothetical protein
LRIIKEYELKNYEKRFGVPCAVVLAALLGPKRAEFEVIKNGISKK